MRNLPETLMEPQRPYLGLVTMPGHASIVAAETGTIARAYTKRRANFEFSRRREQGLPASDN